MVVVYRCLQVLRVQLQAKWLLLAVRIKQLERTVATLRL
jgi:hypothetical protein